MTINPIWPFSKEPGQGRDANVTPFSITKQSDWIDKSKGESLKTIDKSQWPTMEDPWKADSPNRPTYNEGNRISTYDDPTWPVEEFNGNPITDTHDPCGYWTKNYIPPEMKANPYLIGWYKFDEGSGLIAYNSATNGSLGGGLLPNLTVVNNRGDFWTYEPGFASNPVRNDPQNYAFCTFPERTFGKDACYAVFFKSKPLLPAELGAGIIISILQSGGVTTWFYKAIDNVSGTPMVELRYQWSGVSQIASLSANNIWCLWRTHFADTTNDNTHLLVKKVAAGTEYYGYPTDLMTSAKPITQISVGCLWDTSTQWGCGGVWGDVLIFNNKRLTYVEWTEWINYLRSRY